jgi:hypothetical protein
VNVRGAAGVPAGVHRHERHLVKTTQIAFPERISSEVYASGVYASHGQNPTTNVRDGIFADGVNDELATVSGDVTAGYTAALTIGVSV